MSTPPTQPSPTQLSAAAAQPERKELTSTRKYESIAAAPEQASPPVAPPPQTQHRMSPMMDDDSSVDSSPSPSPSNRKQFTIKGINENLFEEFWSAIKGLPLETCRAKYPKAVTKCDGVRLHKGRCCWASMLAGHGILGMFNTREEAMKTALVCAVILENQSGDTDVALSTPIGSKDDDETVTEDEDDSMDLAGPPRQQPKESPNPPKETNPPAFIARPQMTGQEPTPQVAPQHAPMATVPMHKSQTASREPQGTSMHMPQTASREPQGTSMVMPQTASREPRGTSMHMPQTASREPQGTPMHMPQTASREPQGTSMHMPQTASREPQGALMHLSQTATREPQGTSMNQSQTASREPQGTLMHLSQTATREPQAPTPPTTLYALGHHGAFKPPSYQAPQRPHTLTHPLATLAPRVHQRYPEPLSGEKKKASKDKDNGRPKPCEIFNPVTNQVMECFPSFSQAEFKTGVSRAAIAKLCQAGGGTVDSYYFRYSGQPPIEQQAKAKPPSSAVPTIAPRMVLPAPAAQPPLMKGPLVRSHLNQPVPTSQPPPMAAQPIEPRTEHPATKPKQLTAVAPPVPTTKPPSSAAPPTKPPSSMAPLTKPPSSTAPPAKPPSSMAPPAKPPSSTAPHTKPPSSTTDPPTDSTTTPTAPATTKPSAAPPPAKHTLAHATKRLRPSLPLHANKKKQEEAQATSPDPKRKKQNTEPFDVSSLLPVRKKQRPPLRPKKLIELVEQRNREVLVCFRGLTDATRALGLDRKTVTGACQAYATPHEYDFGTFTLKYAEAGKPPKAYEYGAHKEDVRGNSETHSEIMERWNKAFTLEKVQRDLQQQQLEQQQHEKEKAATEARRAKEAAKEAAKETIEDQQPRDQCIMCQKTNVQVVFEPCHHSVLCKDCSEKSCRRYCPLCRTPITGRMQPNTMRLVRPRIYSAYAFM